MKGLSDRGGGPSARDGGNGIVGEQRLDSFMDSTDRPGRRSPTVRRGAPGDRRSDHQKRHVVRWFTIGTNEEVVGLGVRLVAVDVGGVIQKIVLVARLRVVIREGPVDEILDGADKSDVVVHGAVMVGRRNSAQ